MNIDIYILLLHTNIGALLSHAFEWCVSFAAHCVSYKVDDYKDEGTMSLYFITYTDVDMIAYYLLVSYYRFVAKVAESPIKKLSPRSMFWDHCNPR